MRIGIVGGVLQGMEVTYLAKKAGMETLVIDSWKDAPALHMANESAVIDVVKDGEKAFRLLSECDVVIPANENMETLSSLDKRFRESKVPLMFDLHAYQISSSKVRSNAFMSLLGVPMPLPWPECGFPVIVKPSGESGSCGVMKASDIDQLTMGIERIREMGDDVVVQEFVEGQNISIEVIGDGQRAMPLVTTEIVLDAGYDCKMVKCPIEGLNHSVEELFRHDSKEMAERLGLRGIMDVEAIVKDGKPKVLEIDARIPSQTPATVLHSSGINIIDILSRTFIDGLPELIPDAGRFVFYEHIMVEGGTMTSCGEGRFSEVRKPRVVEGLFGSDEMITDFQPDKDSWRATIINSAKSPKEAAEKRLSCIREIMKRNEIETFFDPVPEAGT
jgi:pyrrolysine biosynthesis protein PylC